MTRRHFPAACAGLSAALASPAGAAAAPGPINERNEAYRQELEQYFRGYLVDGYSARAAKSWRRSYTSVGAFLRSVEPNRERYRTMFNPPPLERTGRCGGCPLSTGRHRS
jgi:hypothetical protein